MLGARTGVDGDTRDQELRITADKKLRHGRETDDDIASPEHLRALKEAGNQTVDALESLSDKIRDRGERAKLQQAEADLFHHHGKKDRCDAVLQMIERVAYAYHAQREPLFPKRRFERRRVGGWRCGSCDRGRWIVHGNAIPEVMKY